jgi:hypothetical protein
MERRFMSHGFAWLCGAEEDEIFYHWSGDDFDLWWSELADWRVPFPGYWGA